MREISGGILKKDPIEQVFCKKGGFLGGGGGRDCLSFTSQVAIRACNDFIPLCYSHTAGAPLTCLLTLSGLSSICSSPLTISIPSDLASALQRASNAAGQSIR